jgi:RNA polymerase sigma factor (sigma-70 family)
MAQAGVHSDVDILDDEALLRRYTAENDGQALEQLVRRYAPMVYAAARRQVRDPAMADDVAQCAFVAFARRAGAIRSGAALGAWLLQTTRYTAANAVKAENTRRRYEQAAQFHRPHPQADPREIAADADERRQWESLRPCLDSAIARLSRRDQSAVILRFFRGLSLVEVARSLEISEEAARKRVSRALRRLRKSLVTLGAWPTSEPPRANLLCAVPNAPSDAADSALAAVLIHRGIEPASLSSIAQLASAARAAGDAARASIFHGVLTMAASTKATIAVVLGASVLGTGYVATRMALADQPPVTQPAPLTPAEQLANWQDEFEVWTADQALAAAYKVDNDSQRSIAHALAAQSVAEERLAKLVRQKWGATAEVAVAHAFNTDTRDDDATAKYTIDGDHAKVIFKSDAIEDLLLVRDNGTWKIDVAAYQQMFGPNAPDVIRSTLQSVPILETAIADVTAGKYSSSDQLLADLKGQISKIAPGQ